MKKFVLYTVISGVSLSAFAATEPEGIDMGGAELIPTLRIELSHNDNIFSQSTSGKSSSITRLKPRFEYLAENDKARFSAVYDGNLGKYAQSSDDDYDDHTFSLGLGVMPSDFFRANFDVSAGRLHEDRGSLASEGDSALSRRDPDEYDLDEYGVLLDFGRETARLGASIGFTQADKEYTNNDISTFELNREETIATARLYGRLAGKTKFFIEGQEKEFEYDDLRAGVVQDSEESVVSIGAEWEATGKTSGSIKVGRLNKDFDAGSDDDITAWDVGIVWSPQEYSHFTVSSSQGAKESNGSGDYIESTSHSLSWAHYWSDRFSSSVTVSTGSDEYPGTTREDDRDNFSVGFDYDWQRWLNLGLSFTREERDSNVAQFDYERNIVLLHIDLSL